MLKDFLNSPKSQREPCLERARTKLSEIITCYLPVKIWYDHLKHGKSIENSLQSVCNREIVIIFMFVSLSKKLKKSSCKFQ